MANSKSAAEAAVGLSQLLADSSDDRANQSVRFDFMRAHGRWLYDELTDGRRAHATLTELAYGAAARVPGLTPSADQFSSETGKLQSEKRGLEIDQGILIAGFLSDEQSGNHLLNSLRRPTQRAIALLDEFRSRGLLDLKTVRLERFGVAGHITIQNTHCLNAEDNQLGADMETAVDLVLLDSQIRVGVLRGGVMTHPRYQGRRVFCAGINLKALHAGQISFIEFILQRELGYIRKIECGLYSSNDECSWEERIPQKPWIAAVDSFAIGGGAQLLLPFDKVIAAADSYISLPAAREGIIPGVSNLRLAKLAGLRMANQMILLDRKVYATEQAAQFLIDEVADPTEIEERIGRSVQQFSAPAIRENRTMLRLHSISDSEFRTYMAQFSLRQAKRLYSSDVLKNIAAGPSGRTATHRRGE